MRLAVSTISRVEVSDWSISLVPVHVSKPSGMGIGSPVTMARCASYFDDLGDDAGADGAAAFADGEAQALSIAIGAISSTSS